MHIGVCYGFGCSFFFSNTNFQNTNKIMIKANELRIGNFVEWNKGLFKCCQIFNNSVENELWCKPLNELHPIEITEQILVKLGFSKDTEIQQEFSYVLKLKNRITVAYYKADNSCFSIEQDNKLIDLGHSKVKYLHQLQNIVFSLVGEELVFSSTEP
mgnify:CR=1 FL=1